MTNFSCRTQGNAPAAGKPRVYFTCHPDDFERSFDWICEDLFRVQNCAVYYTEDMTQHITDEEQNTELARMNLFVLPVSLKLLLQPNRAMDRDFLFARQNHIPVLPIMVETGLDAIYAQLDKFGELQYLDPVTMDYTAIDYREKLKKYLQSVLISSDLADRIRAAFDTYVFLSYRKKDRKYANELMQMIHRKPEFWDVAIWYDEFLTPGESFRENIRRMLEDSHLFALLVTPSILEEPDGKPNFVMGNEFPEARNLGMQIIPAEMEPTDKAALEDKFRGIPACVDPHDDAAFRERLLNAIQRAAIADNDDPEHTYLVGLAYLDGIDMETDRERGMELITKAAEGDLPEAMEALWDRYYYGAGVAQNLEEAAFWGKKLMEYRLKNLGEDHPDTIYAISALSATYDGLGEYAKARELAERSYVTSCWVFGQESQQTVRQMHSLALSCYRMGDYRRALELQEQAYEISCRISGPEDPETLSIMNGLCQFYDQTGEYGKALVWKERAYSICRQVLGEEHPDTLLAMYNLAYGYDKNGEYTKALELNKKVYDLFEKHRGLLNPHTIAVLRHRVTIYCELGAYEEADDLCEEIIARQIAFQDGDHPDVIQTRGARALIKSRLGKHREALEEREKVYALSCKVMGEEHPETLTAMNNLAKSYHETGDTEKALDLQKQLYALSCKVRGQKHPKTILAMLNLAVMYDGQQGIELCEQSCADYCELLGEEHPDTLNAFSNLSVLYERSGNYEKALEMDTRIYELRCKNLGPSHPDTLLSMSNLINTYCKLGKFNEVLELCEQAWELSRNALGKENQISMIILRNLSYIHEKLGDYDNALKRKSELYRIQGETLGLGHPETLVTQNEAIELCMAVKNIEGARFMAEASYSFHCQVYGEEHEYTLAVLKRLALVYTMAEEHQLALECQRLFYKIMRKQFDKEHPDMILEALLLARLMFQAGITEDAIGLLNWVFMTARNVLGDDHEITQQAYDVILDIKKVFEDNL